MSDYTITLLRPMAAIASKVAGIQSEIDDLRQNSTAPAEVPDQLLEDINKDLDIASAAMMRVKQGVERSQREVEQHYHMVFAQARCCAQHQVRRRLAINLADELRAIAARMGLPNSGPRRTEVEETPAHHHSY